MARPRRLRHKMMLGLALVVGSVGLLLGGTLYGRNAYHTTAQTTERKLDELKRVSVIIAVLEQPIQAEPTDVTSDLKLFQERTRLAAEFLKEYRKFHAETVTAGLDPDDGVMEAGLLDKLDTGLGHLELVLTQYGSTGTVGLSAESPPPRNDPKVRKAYDATRLVAEELRVALIDDIKVSVERSNASILRSTWAVGAATVWALAMAAALLYYFREWMFTPIRELQAGVQRVHGGDFDHPIRLNSQDELEELANEFNAMTARLSGIYKDLARQVNERSRQLVRSERMVSVGFLAAGVAHEINNPLASILFCAEALERRLQDVLAQAAGARGAEPADAEVLTRYLKMVQQEALRCKDITTKLLDFSRTGERKREATDLAGLITGVLEVARHLPNCRGKNIAFSPDAYIVAPVNAQDLKSVILNLVVNALDSMEDGGHLSICLRADGGFAEMAFTDTGCGMPADVLQNIFEPFFTRSRTGKGTGLGLFISHQIVDQHGGQIEAASAGPGHGSTFTVRIPLRETGGDPMSLPPASAPDPDVSGGHTILPFPGKMAA